MSEDGTKQMTIIFKGSGRVDTRGTAKLINELRRALLDRENRNIFVSLNKGLLGKNFDSIDVMPNSIEYITVSKISSIVQPPPIPIDTRKLN